MDSTGQQSHQTARGRTSELGGYCSLDYPCWPQAWAQLPTWMTISMRRDHRGAAAGGAHLLPSPGEGVFWLHRMAVGPLGPPTVSHGAGQLPRLLHQPRCPQPSGAAQSWGLWAGRAAWWEPGAQREGRQGGTPQARERGAAPGSRQASGAEVQGLPTPRLPPDHTSLNSHVEKHGKVICKGQKNQCVHFKYVFICLHCIHRICRWRL